MRRASRLEAALMAAVDAYAELCDAYQAAYEDHHASGAPRGCPVCADHRPQMEAALHATLAALEPVRVEGHGVVP
jgi:hypothetical protein